MGSTETRQNRSNTIRMNQVRAAAMAHATFGRNTQFRRLLNDQRQESESDAIAEGIAAYIESRKA